MESSSLFMVLSLFLSLVSWRAQGSSWLFCTQQFRAVLCLSPGAFQDTLCPYPECSVLGLQPWAVENVCLQVWHWVEKAPSRRFNHTGSVGTPGLTLE